MKEEIMKIGRWKIIGTLALALAATLNLRAADAEADSMARLDQALKAVATFEYGKDSGGLTLAEQMVMESAKNPAQRAAVEERLLRALNEAGTRDGKEFLCRQLFTIGTARCVPQLEALLTDPSLSHVARFALGRNESPEASEALRRALGKTSGSIQAGILNTLGLRRYTKARPEMENLLGSRDPLVAKAAAAALGQISGIEAVRALEAARTKAPEEVRQKINAALLASADRLLADGQAAAAARVYEDLYRPEQTGNIRIAALRGLAAARQEQALPLLGAAIRGADPLLRAAAIRFSADAQGPESTKALAGLLTSLAPEGQELLLSALGERGDEAALPEVLATARSESPGVRAAACAALGSLGDASVVGRLANAAAAGSGAEQTAARASLVRLKRGEVDGALIGLLSGREPKLVIESIRALAGRRTSAAFEDLLKAATAPDTGVRREAIHALGLLAEERHLPALAKLITDCKNAEDLGAIEEAIRMPLAKVQNPEREARPLVEALGWATAGSKPTLLRLLGTTGAPSALAALRAALKDPDSAAVEAGVRALADWPDAAPADELLALARTAPVPAQKVVALRGYVRLAALGKDPGAMYARALELADRPEDKKLVLSSLAEADPVRALKLLEPYLENEQLKSEAALAMVRIADRLRESDQPRAKAVLRQVMTAAPGPRIRQQAQEVINQTEALDAHILEWVGSGPYQEKEKDARALFDTVFPPEKPDAGEVKWTKLTRGLGAWDVNLLEALGGGDRVAGYVRTRVWSPTGREARLEMGSDDGIKVWLNGTVVHANNAERGLTARQDLAKVTLKEGWNELLLKVTNQGGGWGFSCRIRQPDGTALEGLKFEAK